MLLESSRMWKRAMASILVSSLSFILEKAYDP